MACAVDAYAATRLASFSRGIDQMDGGGGADGHQNAGEQDRIGALVVYWRRHMRVFNGYHRRGSCPFGLGVGPGPSQPCAVEAERIDT